jgi:hypothetical protein
VRPDGFVAWRCEKSVHSVHDATAMLSNALRQSLGHDPLPASV